MVFENEVVKKSENVTGSIRVKVAIQSFQNSNFHERLIEIGRFVFDNFDGDLLFGLNILTADNLAECPLPKTLKDSKCAHLCVCIGKQQVIDTHDQI